MYEQQRSGPHPILILGIGIFLLPIVDRFLPFVIPNWIRSIGLVCIIIGAGLSIFKN